MIHLHDSDVIVIVDFMAFSTRMAPNTRHSVVQCAKKCPIATIFVDNGCAAWHVYKV